MPAVVFLGSASSEPTSLGLWNPTCPTSMVAVFFRLAQGVYTTSRLFCLLPARKWSEHVQENVRELFHVMCERRSTCRVMRG